MLPARLVKRSQLLIVDIGLGMQCPGPGPGGSIYTLLYSQTELIVRLIKKVGVNLDQDSGVVGAFCKSVCSSHNSIDLLLIPGLW